MDRRALMEARSRKILANANSRLEAITGRPSYIKDTVLTEKSPNESGAQNCSTNGVCVSERLHHAKEVSYPPSQSSSKREINADNALFTESKMVANPGKGHLLDCVIFMILGVTMRFSFQHISAQIPMPMYVPFLSIAIPRIFCSPWYSDSLGGIVQMVLTLGGASQRLILKLFSALAFFRTLFKFFSLYLFSFILTHYLVQSLDVKT